MIELIELSRHLPKDAVVSNSTQGKFIPIIKLSETLEVDWFDDGLLGAGVEEAVAEFLADAEWGFPCTHGPVLEHRCGKTAVSPQQNATNDTPARNACGSKFSKQKVLKSV